MSNDVKQCPSCNRVFAPDAPVPSQCARCDADLTPWNEVANAADRNMRNAILQLPENPASALRLVRRACFLHNAPHTRKLSAMIERVSSDSG